MFTSTTRKWIILYFVFTVFSLFLDFTSFFINIKWFGRIQSAYADLSLITIASIFLFLDWFYIMWIVSLNFKFPSYVGISFSKSFLGFVESIHLALGDYLQKSKKNYEIQYHMEKNRYNYV